MDSIAAVGEVKSYLAKKSVRGEHRETKEELRWLDGIGQPEKRLLDLFIFRSMTIASGLGLGGLTDAELEQVGTLMETRFTLAGLLESGQVVERCPPDGRCRYVATVAGLEDRSQDDSFE